MKIHASRVRSAVLSWTVIFIRVYAGNIGHRTIFLHMCRRREALAGEQFSSCSSWNSAVLHLSTLISSARHHTKCQPSDSRIRRSPTVADGRRTPEKMRPNCPYAEKCRHGWDCRHSSDGVVRAEELTLQVWEKPKVLNVLTIKRNSNGRPERLHAGSYCGVQQKK